MCGWIRRRKSNTSGTAASCPTCCARSPKRRWARSAGHFQRGRPPGLRGSSRTRFWRLAILGGRLLREAAKDRTLAASTGQFHVRRRSRLSRFRHQRLRAGQPAADYPEGLRFFAEWNGFIVAYPGWLLRIGGAGDFGRAHKARKIGVMPTMQDSTHFRGPDDVDTFFSLGQRISQLTYNFNNRIGSGFLERRDGGLSVFGLAIVKRIEEVGMGVDVSHCGDQTTLDALEAATKPVIFTHATCRALIPAHLRAKTGEAIRKMAKTGGVMGVSFIRFMVRDREPVTIEHVLDQFDLRAETRRRGAPRGGQRPGRSGQREPDWRRVPAVEPAEFRTLRISLGRRRADRGGWPGPSEADVRFDRRPDPKGLQRWDIRMILGATSCACSARSGRRSEREADREQRRVVVLAVVRGGDLEARADGHQQMPMQLESPQYQTRCQKCLLLAVQGAVVPRSRVYLEFRPQLLQNVVLKCCVPGQRMAYGVFMADGQPAAESALYIESAPPFAAGNGGRDHGSARPIGMRAGGDGATQEERENVAAGLLVGRQHAVLSDERHIPESIVDLRVVVFDVGRHIEEQLHTLVRDQLEALAVAEVDQVVASRHLLHQEIGAELLFESGGDGGQRRHPVRLIGLGLVRALEPVVAKTILRIQGAAAYARVRENQEQRFLHGVVLLTRICTDYKTIPQHAWRVRLCTKAPMPVARGGQSRYD